MYNRNNGWVIFASFIVALILMLLPMPSWTVWLRPSWVLLVLIFWTMHVPYRVNVGIAWLMGIILDVLNGTLLGEHALALSIVIYFVARIHSRLCMFPLLQQGLSVFLLVLFYQAIIYCIQGFIGDLPRGILYWSSALTSMLLWPWVYSILRDVSRRFKMA